VSKTAMIVVDMQNDFASIALTRIIFGGRRVF
jgi:hypothetical protein